MNRLATALVLLGAFALRGQPAAAPPQAAPQPRTGIIRGRVTAAETGLPVPNAHLSLIGSARDEAAGGFEPIVSDSDGRFQFLDVPAGQYTVLAARAGYLNTRFGAKSYFDRPVTVVLADGAVVDGIDFRLTKSAAISGRIVDDLGDPAVGANVSVSRRVRVDGRDQLSSLKSTRTDDLGEYRLGGLPAGDYIVTIGGGGGAATRWTRTFFPGVMALARAQPVTVGAGDEISGRDFAASPVGAAAAAKPARLSGTIVSADGSPATGRLIVAGIDEPPGTASTSSQPISANGEFSFQVEPGDHVLIAQGPGGTAGLRVTVDSADVSGLRLVLMKGGRLSGRIAFEGSAPPPALDTEIEAWSPDFSAGVGLAFSGPPGAQATSFQPRKANRDGTFELENLFGARELRVRGVPAGWTVKSITHEGRSIAEVPIDFGGVREMTGVQVLLSNRAAQLTGVATDGSPQAITEYSVVVFPDDQARVFRPSRVAQWVRPDQNGRFTIDGLAPGTYFVAAVDRVIDDQWSNREYLDRLRPQATRVTLADGEKKTMSLERIAP